MLGRAVIFFQLEYLDAIAVEILLKIQDVLDCCAPKSVNTLGIIAHYTNVARAALIMHQFANDAVLKGIGILKLVHQQVAEALAVFVQYIGVLLPELVKAVQEVVKIHGPCTFAALTVFEVNFADEWHFGLPILHFQFLVFGVQARSDQAAFGRRDATADGIDVVNRLVQVHLFDDRSNHTFGIFGIVNREIGGIANLVRFHP